MQGSIGPEGLSRGTVSVGKEKTRKRLSGELVEGDSIGWEGKSRGKRHGESAWDMNWQRERQHQKGRERGFFY